MAGTVVVDAQQHVDAVEEIRLRTWARKHYVPGDERLNLHPVILDEMRRRDAELSK
ncbi:MAG: hypothetical protein KDA88_06180 [Planctomycetaceae bacterium]|nr:hypothetical protein [Planctomycetaceae bacterium]